MALVLGVEVEGAGGAGSARGRPSGARRTAPCGSGRRAESNSGGPGRYRRRSRERRSRHRPRGRGGGPSGASHGRCRRLARGACPSRWTPGASMSRVGGSQKGLMTPPGLAFIAASERARAVHRNADLVTRYWDWTFRGRPGTLPEVLRHCARAPDVRPAPGARDALCRRHGKRVPAPRAAR